jgi:hypothetical protein
MPAGGTTSGAAGCSGAGAGGGPPIFSGDAGPSCNTDYDRIAADTTPTSFIADVMPIFQISCTASQCHCNTDTTPNCLRVPWPPYLGVSVGSDVTRAIADTVYASLVNVPSSIAQGVMLVAPGNPAESFLVQKISNTQNSQCHDCALTLPGASPPCGSQMPNVGDELCTAGSDGQARFDTIARWIAQGAENN